MTRRLSIIVFASMLLIAGACSSDTDGDTSEQAPPATAADTDGSNDADGDDGGDTDASAGEDSGSTKSKQSGRLEIGDDDYNFWLGDMMTAMCSVDGDDVMIEDMRASDGSRVSAVVSGGISEITLRGPDGNRVWVTGNSAEAEGVDVNVQTIDNVLNVKGTWVDPDDPNKTEQGHLVITC